MIIPLFVFVVLGLHKFQISLTYINKNKCSNISRKDYSCSLQGKLCFVPACADTTHVRQPDREIVVTPSRAQGLFEKLGNSLNSQWNR